ncbi:MAG TPA: Ig-like domain-containing protein [Blastocatellia bacterium]|nr:Ig-like domain-containing protein [Blastocatellia bacterium]
MNYARFLALSLVMLIATAATGMNRLPLNEKAGDVNAQAKCPTVRTSCPDSVKVGEDLTFTVNVSGGDNNVTPTYNWAISAGTISSGQGTSTIIVETKEAGGMTITATVDVGGYDRSCSTASSCTASVLKKAVKVAEYGKVKPAEEKAILDKFAAELESDSSAQGYIISYETPKGPKMEAFKASDNAIQYLIKQRNIAAGRFLPATGGYREQVAIELWLVPSGADMPQATPTIDPSKVKPTKEKPAPPAKPKTSNKKS